MARNQTLKGTYRHLSDSKYWNYNTSPYTGVDVDYSRSSTACRCDTVYLRNNMRSRKSLWYPYGTIHSNSRWVNSSSCLSFVEVFRRLSSCCDGTVMYYFRNLKRAQRLESEVKVKWFPWCVKYVKFLVLLIMYWECARSHLLSVNVPGIESWIILTFNPFQIVWNRLRLKRNSGHGQLD